MEVAADGPHDHLPRVQADPDVDRNAYAPLNLLRVPFHPLLHSERGVTRPDRMIFVGQRGAEQGHDPVAHDLVDGSLVPVDGLHHVFQHRI